MLPAQRPARVPARPPAVAGAALLAVLVAVLARGVSAQGTATPAGSPTAADLLARADGLAASPSDELRYAALIAYERAAVAAAAAADAGAQARARLGRGRVLLALGRAGEALPAIDEASRLASVAGEVPLRRAVLEVRAEAALASGLDGEAALALAELAASLEEGGARGEETVVRLRLAEIQRSCGRRGAERAALDEALRASRAAADPGLMIEVLAAKARMERRLGQADAARAALEEALLLAAEEARPEATGSLLVEVALTERAAGELTAALQAAVAAESACLEAADLACQAEADELVGALLLSVQQPARAVERLLAALVARRRLGDRAGEARAQFGIARGLAQLDRLEPALAALREGAALLPQADAGTAATLSLLEARLLAGLDRPLEAALCYDAALCALSVAGVTSGLDPLDPAAADHARALDEELALLADHGLWARALEAVAAGGRCDRVPPGAGPRADLDTLRTLAHEQDATLVVHHPLADRLLAWALSPDGRLTGTAVLGADAAGVARLAAATAALDRQRVEGALAAARLSAQGGDLAAVLEPPASLALLRRAHDTFVAPLGAALEDPLGEAAPDDTATRAVLVRQHAALGDLPAGLLPDEEGRPVASRHAVFALPPDVVTPPERRGAGLVVAATLPTLALAAARDALGLPPPGLPQPPGAPRLLSGPEATERAVREASREAGALLLLAECDPGDGTEGIGGPALVAWPGEGWADDDGRVAADEVATLGAPGVTAVLLRCSGRPAALLASAWVRGGARAVIHARWPLTLQEERRVAAGVAPALAAGERPADVLRAAAAALDASGRDARLALAATGFPR